VATGPNDGRLIAIDICESAACGGRGTFQVAWFHAFDGPSSASPVLIGQRLFFDGLVGYRTGTVNAVDDLGGSSALAWSARFTGRFGASASRDPRGGIWVAPWQSGELLRLGEKDGDVVQRIDISTVMGLAPGYSSVTAVSVSSIDDELVLTFGAQTNASSGDISPYVVAIDVSSAPQGAARWKFKVSSNPKLNAATGQMPVVVNAAGSRRIVFRGTRSSTFFIGEP
jgi:hypothetical protein